MFDKSHIMSRAWELMRQVYKLGRFTFAEIGMDCWRYCLRHAWQEAKEAARKAAIPANEKARQIASLKAQMDNVNYLPFGMSASKHRAMLQEQINQLAA